MLPLCFAECYHKVSSKKLFKEKKIFVDKFLEDFYVDDSTTGVKTLEEGKVFSEKARGILQKSVFVLGKGMTNSKNRVANVFEERENFGNKTETGNNVYYLESQLRANVINSKRVLGVK